MENQRNNGLDGASDGKQDCGCEGGCCPPKRKNPFTKILFAVVIVAALGIIGFKLFHQKAPAAAKSSCCPQSSTSACDTAKKTTCDTIKGSSCCPKK